MTTKKNRLFFKFFKSEPVPTGITTGVTKDGDACSY
jgi:hypothetical protein